MNPRLLCRERTFHKALLLTYSFDPVFFEQIVLPDLWAGRASDILVLGDGDQVQSAVNDAVGRLWHLGKRYVLGRAAHTGSFHPKVLLRIGATEGAVMIGSGNLTSCGWGGNKELGCAWLFGPNHADKGAWLPAFLDEVSSWCAGDLERDSIRRMKDVAWLSLGSAASTLPAPFLYSSTGLPLSAVLAQRWAGRRFSDVRILTGSTDEGGVFLRWAHKTFGVQRAVIALTPSQAHFSLSKLADLPVELRLIPMAGAMPLHAKFYFFDGPEGAGAVMGSPNCSAAAWVIPPEHGGNIETALVYDSPKPDEFHALLEIFDSPSFSPQDVLMKITPTPVESGQDHNGPYELAGLQWDALSHRLMAVIHPRPEPEIAITLLLGTRRIPMRPAAGQIESGWFCEVPEGIDFTSSAFAAVRLERGDQHWLTGIRWIDHLAELHHAAQASRFLDPIKGLENSNSHAEQRRILEDLQLVAQALFSDSGSFKDSGFVTDVPEEPQNSEPPAPPVDPASLIRDLEDLKPLHGALGGAAPSNVSLTGILRLLFDAERAVGNGVAAAADDEKLDEGQAVSLAPTAPKKPSSNLPEHGKPVDARLRSRLESQIDNFLKDLSKPEFVRDCSATRLIQAVCFPLAVAIRGQNRGWVSAASAEQWGLKLVSLLFRGRTAGSPGLLGAVEQRYASNGQAAIFREVIGDGTLWIVLIATLGNSNWQGAGTFLDKAIALREVFRAPQLISSARVDRISGLLFHLRIEDARAFLSLVAPEVSELLDCIESQLRPVWEQEKHEQAARALPHRAGDLLWRSSAGWAVCLEDTNGGENMEVRLRGERKKVKANFYANVSDLAKRNHKLSKLLADLSARLESAATLIRA
jgi:HKD family nuclease